MDVDMHQLRKTALKLIAQVVEEDRLEYVYAAPGIIHS